MLVTWGIKILKSPKFLPRNCRYCWLADLSKFVPCTYVGYQVTNIHYFKSLRDHWGNLDIIAVCLFLELLSSSLHIVSVLLLLEQQSGGP